MNKQIQQLEEKLRLSQQAEEHYRIFTELIADFAYVACLDADGAFQIEWMSGAGIRILGYAPDQVRTTQQLLGIIHPDDRSLVVDRLKQVSLGQEVADEVRFIRSDGKTLWMRVSARPIFNPQTGQVVKLYGAGQDITERKQKELALAQNQGRYHTLFEDSPVALWEEDYSEVKAALDRMQREGVTDVRAYFEQRPEEAMALISLSKVINVNRAALKLRGFTKKEELIEFKSTVVRFEPARILMRLDAVARGLIDFEMEGQSPTRDGGLRYTVWHYSVVPGYEQTYGRLIVSIQDVTVSHNVENSLRREAGRLELLNSITDISLALGDLKTSVRTLSERMRAYAGAFACFITGWDASTQTQYFMGGTNIAEELISQHPLKIGEISLTQTTIDAGRPVVVTAYQGNPINSRIELVFGQKSALGLPLRVGERKVGAAVLVFDEPPEFSSEGLDVWNQISDQVSLAIASLQLYDQSERRKNELEKLVMISSDLRRAQSYNEILDLVMHEMVKVVRGERGGMIIKRGKKWMLVDDQSFKPATELVGPELSDERMQSILNTAQKLAGVFPPPGGYAGKSPWLQGLGSFTFVPLQTSDAIIGGVTIGWREKPEISPENQRLLTTIAEIGGNALQRADLLETLEQRVSDRTRDLQILYDLSALANRQVGMKKVMLGAVRELVKVVNGKAGVLLQVKPGENSMELLVSCGLATDIVKQIERAQVDVGRWKRIIDATEPTYIPDLRNIPDIVPEIIRLGMNAGIWIPLRASGAPWGIISVFGEAASLNMNENKLVTAVSDLLGTVVENDLLQRQAKRAAVMEERQRLARELHDSVSQSIYGLTLLAEAGREYALQGNREPTLHYLERTSETAHQALREMRMLLYELRPPELEKLGLEGALRYRLEAVERRVGLEAGIIAKQTAPISGECQEALFWIAQEALNNTLKHANATRVNLNLRVGARRVRMEIADNGLGFEPGAVGSGGMGLVGMRERADKIGARLDIGSAPGKGTRVSVELDPSHAMKEKSEYE